MSGRMANQLFGRKLRSRSPVGPRDRFGDQALTGLTGMDIAQSLVLRVDIKQARVARLATNHRVRDYFLECSEHVGDDRPVSICGSSDRLIEQLRKSGP